MDPETAKALVEIVKLVVPLLMFGMLMWAMTKW